MNIETNFNDSIIQYYKLTNITNLNIYKKQFNNKRILTLEVIKLKLDNEA